MRRPSSHTSSHEMRGFTLFEVVVTTAVASIMLAGFTSIFGSTGGLVEDDRAQTRATAEHRRNLEALANVLRGIDLETLQGVDVSGEATAPQFARVTGADLDGRTYGDSEELRWLPASGDLDGVEQPGAVFLITPSGQRLIADRVPAGGFRIRQQGNTLVIHLTTYYTTRARRTVLTSGHTAVSMRN